jgi:hypothetical protein
MLKVRLSKLAVLIEVGDAQRAEFIRLQVELGRVWDESAACTCRAAEDKFHCPSCSQWDEYASIVGRIDDLWAFNGVLELLRSAPFDDESWAFALGHRFNSEWNPPKRVVVRRGFVDEVRLPLAAFVGGGVCENCEGTGRVDGDRFEQSEPCPDCGGEIGPGDEDNPRGVCPSTGRVEGLARSLAEQHPLTRVVLTDREPVELRDGWHWPVGDNPRGIPWDFYDRMPSMPYPTREDALDTLALAAAAWARSLVPWLNPQPTA